MSMTTSDTVAYYANLLIKQYLGKPKAYSTILGTASPLLIPQTSTQQISYSRTPTSGSYTLSYDGSSSSSIAFGASDSDVQTALRTITALASVTVSGLLVTFVNVAPPAELLLVESNSLEASGIGVTVTITETDVTLPIAVQDGFNLTGNNVATGVQLDALGLYAGVSRSGVGVSGPVTLGDSDFLVLIQFATVINSAQSDLNTIVTSLFNFFGDNILVFDYQNMHMSYLINSVIGSQDLIQLLISENLLPVPMAVQVSVIYAPIITTFFGFVTYQIPTATNNSPFNTYADYQTDWPWLDYSDGFAVITILTTESGNNLTQENGGLIYLG